MSDIVNFANQNQETILISTAVVLSLLIVWNIYLQYNLLKIKKRTRSFFASSEAKDLEEIIYKQIGKINKIDYEVKKLIDNDEKIEGNLSKCIQKTGVVRFNPFNDVGGNQSFAVAFLDNSLNGVIILSLYSREGMRIYSKSIKNGKSEYALSEEEKEAIKLASGA
jgi:hypothetical protein